MSSSLFWNLEIEWVVPNQIASFFIVYCVFDEGVVVVVDGSIRLFRVFVVAWVVDKNNFVVVTRAMGKENRRSSLQKREAGNEEHK